MKISILGFVSLLAIAVIPPAAWAEVPLPADISIASPPAELRKELTAFSGRWEGNWSGNLEAVLIIERIDAQSADVIYAFGDAPAWNVKKGYRRFKAKVAEGTKTEIAFSSGSVYFTVTMNIDLSSINVQRTSNTGSAIETFKKVIP